MLIFKKKDDVQRSGDNWVNVESIGFHGLCSESPNGEYIVGWRDSSFEKKICGSRDSGNGDFVLARKGLLLFHGESQRPNKARVANNGTFIINDCMFGENRQGTFFVFNKHGDLIVKDFEEKNIQKGIITPDGNYAICLWALGFASFFDVGKRIVLWKKSLEVDNITNVHFDEMNTKIYFTCKDGSLYGYDFDGELIDKDAWEKAKVDAMTSFHFLGEAEGKWKKSNKTLEDIEEIERLLNLSLDRGDFRKYPKCSAKVYRLWGETKEALGMTDAAVSFFEKAIDLDPNVGLKKRLAKLRG